MRTGRTDARTAGSSSGPRDQARGASRRGWSLLSIVSLVAIVSVVVMVSLSRLRGFVVHENEQDALSAVRLLGEELVALGDPAPDAPSIESLFRSARLERRLPDASFLGDGRLMQCHGYYFELVRIEGAPVPRPAPGEVQAAAPGRTSGGSGGRVVVRAWPCVPGQTGTALLIATEAGLVLGHPNREHRWGGRGRPPALPGPGGDWARAGWQAIAP